MTTAENVRVAVTGSVSVGPLTADLPTDATTTIDNDYDDVGYVSEDGVVQSIGEDITEIKAWQNSDIVRKVQTKHDLTYALTMIETSEVSLSTFYGNYAGGTVEITSDQLDHLRWVIDVIDGDVEIRIVIPDGQIGDRGDVTYKNGDALGYPITITCYPDADGVKAYIYHHDFVASA